MLLKVFYAYQGCIYIRGAPIRISEADHRKAESADPITDTDLFKAFLFIM